MNVVAGCPLNHCHVVVGKQSQSCFYNSGTKLTATGIFGDLLNLASGPPRPGASLSDNNYMVITLEGLHSEQLRLV